MLTLLLPLGGNVGASVLDKGFDAIFAKFCEGALDDRHKEGALVRLFTGGNKDGAKVGVFKTSCEVALDDTRNVGVFVCVFPELDKDGGEVGKDSGGDISSAKDVTLYAMTSLFEHNMHHDTKHISSVYLVYFI